MGNRRRRRILIAQKKYELIDRQDGPNLTRVIIGKVEGKPVEIMVDPEDRIKRGKCLCGHFKQFGLRNGPCRHMIALRWGVSIHGLAAYEQSGFYNRLLGQDVITREGDSNPPTASAFEALMRQLGQPACFPETLSAMLRRGCSLLPIASPRPLFVWATTTYSGWPKSNPRVSTPNRSWWPLVNDLGPKRRSQDASTTRSRLHVGGFDFLFHFLAASSAWDFSILFDDFSVVRHGGCPLRRRNAPRPRKPRLRRRTGQARQRSH